MPNPPVGRGDCRGSVAGRHEDHRRGLGRGRRLPGRFVRHCVEPCGDVGGMERTLPRRHATRSGEATPACLGAFATRLSGSSDLYEHGGRPPVSAASTSSRPTTASPLNDLVSYSDKHNEANGEGNRDGDNNNHSYNYGVEGPTTSQGIGGLRAAADQEHAVDAAAEPGRSHDWSPATSAAARSTAITTPTARTTRSPGSIGSWSEEER